MCLIYVCFEYLKVIFDLYQVFHHNLVDLWSLSRWSLIFLSRRPGRLRLQAAHFRPVLLAASEGMMINYFIVCHDQDKHYFRADPQHFYPTWNILSKIWWNLILARITVPEWDTKSTEKSKSHQRFFLECLQNSETLYLHIALLLCRNPTALESSGSTTSRRTVSHPRPRPHPWQPSRRGTMRTRTIRDAIRVSNLLKFVRRISFTVHSTCFIWRWDNMRLAVGSKPPKIK